VSTDSLYWRDIDGPVQPGKLVQRFDCVLSWFQQWLVIARPVSDPVVSFKWLMSSVRIATEHRSSYQFKQSALSLRIKGLQDRKMCVRVTVLISCETWRLSTSRFLANYYVSKRADWLDALRCCSVSYLTEMRNLCVVMRIGELTSRRWRVSVKCSSGFC